VILIDDGLLTYSSGRIAATPKGRQMLNSVLKMMLGG